MADSDRVKVGIYTSSNGVITIVTERKVIDEFREHWTNDFVN